MSIRAPQAQRSRKQPGTHPPCPATPLKPLAAFVKRACLPAGVLLTLPLQAALAAPQGGQVVAGQGNIDQSVANTTTINQHSQRLAIDWQSFNVSAHELVQFKQPGRDAAALNRIFDQNPSQIFGRVQANGQVFLMNPNGVVFGPSARVNVGGLVAAGANIRVEDFMAGNFRLEAVDGASGLVVNQGLIEAATGGSVTLAGKAVRNEGVIVASAGRVNLVAGSKMTLDFDGDGLIQFAVDEAVLDNAAQMDAAVSNAGEIQADGGQVLLAGHAAQDVFSRVVNNEGVIKAGRIDNQGGVVRLVGLGPEASVLNTGSIDVSAQGAGDGGTVSITGGNVEQAGVIRADAGQGSGGSIELVSGNTTLLTGDSLTSARGGTGDPETAAGSGGTIQVLGDRVGLMDSATVDASGDAGGGTVLIGGDFQGANPDVLNAARTYVGPEAVIRADAMVNGDGGTVIVWADQFTVFEGSLSARGGAAGGDGGFAEISGKKSLKFNGQVDVRADNGALGTVLFDPVDIVVSDADDTDGANGGTILFADDPAAEPWNVSPAQLDAVAGNVILQAENDITFTNAVSLTTAGASLTAQAGNNINVNAAITTNNGVIHLEADSPHATGGSTGVGTLTIGGDITSGGAAITLIGADFVISNDVKAGAGNINITRSQNAALVLGSGVLSAAEVGKFTTTGTLTLGAATTAGSDGAGTGLVSLTADSISVDADFLLASADNVALVATGSVSIADLTSFKAPALSLSAGSNITDGGAGVFQSTGGDLTLVAGGGVGVSAANPLNVVVGTGKLIVESKGAGAAGDVFITSAAGMDVGQIKTDVDSQQTVSVAVTGGTSMTVKDAAEQLAGDIVSFDSGSGVLTIEDVNFDVGDGSLTLTADEIELTGGAGSIKGAGGTLTLQPFTAAQDIEIAGAGGTAKLDLTAAEIAALQDGFGSIVIGRADGSGAVRIATAITFNDPVTIRSPAGAGSITVGGQITGAGDASITLLGTGATTTLNADIVTAGNAILIDDKVVLGSAATVTLDTTNAGAVAAGGNITVTKTVEDDGVTASALVLKSGTAGAIDLQGAVGGVTPIVSLTASGASGSFQAVTTKQAQDYSGLTLTTLNGTLTVNTAGFGVTAGAVNLGAGGGTITLTGSDAANDVTLGTVNGAQALDITAEGGDIVLGAVGQSTALTTVTLKANTASLQAVKTSGAQSYANVGTTTLNGTLDITTAGAGVTAGAVNLAAGGGTIALTGTNAANDVTLGAVNGAQALDITAEGGDIVLGAVGGTTPLTGVTLKANTASLQAVTTTGAQSYGDVTTSTLNGNLTTSNGAVTLAAVTLGQNVTIDTQATTAAGSISLGAITGGGKDLTLKTGAVAGADVTGTSASGVGTLTLQTIGGTASFTGAVSAATLAAGATVENVSLTGSGGTITNLVDFQNGGDLTLGQDGGTQTYDGGLTTTGVGGTVTLHGILKTSDDPITLGAITLGSDVTLNTQSAGAGNVTAGTIDGGKALSITAAGAAVQLGAVGGTTPVAGTSISAGTIQLDNVKATGAQSYTATTSTTLKGTSYQSTGDGAISFTGPVLLDAAGTVSIQTNGAAGSNISFSGTSTINGVGAGQKLSMNAGTLGNVTAGASIGGSQALALVEVSSAATASFQGIKVAAPSATDVVISITADEIDLLGGAGSVIGDGTGDVADNSSAAAALANPGLSRGRVILRPIQNDTAIQVGGTTDPGLLLSTTDWAALADHFVLIDVGHSGGTHPIGLKNSAATLIDPTRFNGTVTQTNGPLSLSGDGAFFTTLAGIIIIDSDRIFGGNANAEDFDFTNFKVLIDNDILDPNTVITLNAGGNPIIFGQELSSTAAAGVSERNALELITSNTVTFSGAVGSSFVSGSVEGGALGTVTITASDVVVDNATFIAGSLTVTADTMSVAGTTFTLTGLTADIGSGAADNAGLVWGGPLAVTLAGALNIDSSPSSTPIDLSGASINGAFGVDLKAAGGNINLGNLGNVTPITGLTIQSGNILTLNGAIKTGTVSVNAIATRLDLAANASLTASSGAIDLASGIGAGGIRLTGGAGSQNVIAATDDALITLAEVTTGGAADLKVQSAGSVTLAAVNIGAGDLTVSVDTDNDGNETLTLGGAITAGAGSSFSGTNDTLKAANLNNAWVVTGSNQGTLNGIAFSGFANLIGNAADDSFQFQSVTSISGNVDGGAGGTNTLDYSVGVAGPVTVNIAAGTATGIGGTFANIDTFIGSASAADTLIGPNTDNTWNVTADNGGDINGAFTFSSFENLTGGTAKDAFVFSDGKVVSGTIDGGAGDNTLSLTNYTTAVNWAITGNDAGDVNANAIDFVNIQNLVGGGNTDNFVFSDGKGVTGSIDGGAGNDTLDYSAYTSAVTVDLASGASTGAGGGITSIEILIGGSTAGDTLIGTNAGDTWTSTGADAGTVAGVTFSKFENWTGGSGNDTFNLDHNITGAVSGGAGNDQFDFATGGISVGGGVDGGTDNDTFNVSASITADLSGGDGNDTFNFTGFGTVLTGNVSGGAGDDTFNFGSPVPPGAPVPPGSNAQTARIVGNLDGGAGSDTLDFSGSELREIVTITGSTADGESGTIRGGSGDPDLVSGTFAGINTLTGNGFGQLIGPNADTIWLITGVDSGTFGPTTGAENVFNNFSLLGGTADDQFRFAEAGQLTEGIDGGLGTNTVRGGTAVNTWVITGANAGKLTNTTGTTEFLNIQVLEGSTGADTITINTGVTFNGSIDGRSGSDTLQWQAGTSARNVTLTAVNGDGFSGTEASITGGFAGISVLNGTTNTDSLTGLDAIAAWDLLAGTYVAGAETLTFTSFENLTGGAKADTFNVNANHTGNLAGGDGDDNFIFTGAAVLTGSVNGGLGTGDSLDFSGYGTQRNIQLQGSGTLNGFKGAELNGAITGGFDNINAVQGNAGNNDILTAPDTPNTWEITALNEFKLNGGAVPFTGFTSLSGGGSTDNFIFFAAGKMSGGISGGAGSDTVTASDGGDTFNITAAGAGSITTGAGATNFTSIESLVGGAGDDSFIFGANVNFSGSLNGGGGTNTLDYSAYTNAVTVNLGAGTATGTSSIVGTSFQNILGGTNVNDTLVALNKANTWTISANNEGKIVNGGTITFNSFENLTGGSAADEFVFADGKSITGTLSGGAGNNTLNLSADTTGRTFNITATNAGTVAGVVGSFSQIQNLIGGAGDDSFVLGNGAGVGGTLTGGGGVNTLDYSAYTTAVTVNLDNKSATNVNGAAANGFSGITLFKGGTFSDRLINVGAAAWNITGNNAGTVGGNTFTSFENINGNNATYSFTAGKGLSGALTDPNITLATDITAASTPVQLVGNVNTGGTRTVSSATGAVTITGTTTTGNGNLTLSGTKVSVRAVNSGTGNQTYTGATTLNGNLTGANLVFNSGVTVAGNTIMNSGTNVFRFASSVGGSGNLAINPTAGTDIFIDTTAAPGHINSNAFGSFQGHLIIGGVLNPLAPPAVDASVVNINADTISVDQSFTSGGPITLLASNIDLNADLTAGAAGPAGSEVTLLAIGDALGGTGPGNISGPSSGTVTVSGSGGTFIAVNTIENAPNIRLDFGGGPFGLLISPTADEPSFDPGSSATSIELDPNALQIVQSLQALGAGVVFQAIQLVFTNPGAALTALENIQYIDIGVFAEELTIFGIIGQGIALDLSQCEEAEGCAPSISEEELLGLIAALEARIAELERRKAAGEVEPEVADGLLEGFRRELQNYQDYLEELRAWQEQHGDAAFDDFGFDDFGPTEDFPPAEGVEGEGMPVPPGFDEPMPEAAPSAEEGIPLPPGFEDEGFPDEEDMLPLPEASNHRLPWTVSRYPLLALHQPGKGVVWTGNAVTPLHFERY